MIVIEGDATSGYSSYSPDLPGVAAAGGTREECEALTREAITFHIQGLIEEGVAVPAPTNAAVGVFFDPAV